MLELSRLYKRLTGIDHRANPAIVPANFAKIVGFLHKSNPPKRKEKIMSAKILDAVKPGVLLVTTLPRFLKIAKENKFALPAVNVVGTDSINACLEAAAAVKSPVIIQFPMVVQHSPPAKAARLTAQFSVLFPVHSMFT